MITLNATQQAIVDSAVKSVSWLFEITDGTVTPATNYWSTKAYTFGAQAYTYKIIPDSFSGVTLNRSRSELGIRGANDTAFSISNKGNLLAASDFTGGSVLLKLVISDGTNEEIIRRWKFNIRDCQPAYQQIDFKCEDFVRKYLRGDYPNTRRIRDIFPSNDIVTDDNVCVPVPFGTCYIPLRSVYVPEAISISAATISATATATGARCKFSDSGSGFGGIEVGRYITTTGFTNAANNGTFQVLSASAGVIEIAISAGIVTEAAGNTIAIKQGSRYYLLGSSALTYTIAKVRSPRAWGKKSEWPAASYSFNQYTKADADAVNWRMFHAIIADNNKDGIADAPGLWKQGDQFLDMPAQFSRSDTAAKTNPADVMAFVLEDLGINASDIDTGAGSTFEAAASTFTGWGLEFNGSFWKKGSREKTLAQLLLQCHSTLQITDKIELHVLSKTSRQTLTKANILVNTFRREGILFDTLSDSGHILWQQQDESQDQFVSGLVPAKTGTAQIAAESIEIPFVQDSQDVQRIGTLYYQRKFLKSGNISIDTKGTCLALQPDDVITINHADYGGNYDVLIDKITINRDISISMSATLFSDALNDWSDLTPSAITIYNDDGTVYWDITVNGPQSDQDIGTGAFEVWGSPYLIVGPNANDGKFTSIQAAINALAESRHSGIFILDGTYALSAPIYPIDRDTVIKGESQGGVKIQNHAGEYCFVLHNLTKTFNFSEFSIESQNTAVSGYSIMMYIYGDAIADNVSDVEIRNIFLNLADAGVAGASTDDRGIYVNKGLGFAKIYSNKIIGGSYGAIAKSYDKIEMTDNQIQAALCNGLMYDGAGNQNTIIANNLISEVKSRGISCISSVEAVLISNNVINSVANSACIDIAGIYFDNAAVINNLILINMTAADKYAVGILGGASSAVNKIDGNKITIDVTTSKAAEGIEVIGLYDGSIVNNTMSVDNSDATVNHYGINLWNTSVRNIIACNNINLVNNTAKDIGIAIAAGSDNNQGGDNITYNCGTSISDAGTGNAVTAKDV